MRRKRLDERTFLTRNVAIQKAISHALSIAPDGRPQPPETELGQVDRR
jgi:hypothetical protein